MIELEVEDRGDGTPAAERELVFNAFYGGGADTPRSTNGAWLGLAVTRAIVDAHGGQIWLPRLEPACASASRSRPERAVTSQRLYRRSKARSVEPLR